MSYTPAILRSKTTYRLLTLYGSPHKRGSWGIWCLVFAYDNFAITATSVELLDRLMIYNAVKAETEEQIKQKLLEVFQLEEYAKAVKEYGDLLYSALLKLKYYIEGREPYVNQIPVALLEEGVDIGSVLLSRGYGSGVVRVQYRPIKTGTFIAKLGYVKIEDLLRYYIKLHNEIGRPYIENVSIKTDRTFIEKIRSKKPTDVDTIVDMCMDRLNAGTVPTVYVHLIFRSQSDNTYVMVDAKRLLLMPDPSRITSVAILQCSPTTILVFNYKTLKPEEVKAGMLALDVYRNFIQSPGSIDRRVRELISKKLDKQIYGEVTASADETAGNALESFFGGGGEEEATETTAEETATAVAASRTTKLEEEILGGGGEEGEEETAAVNLAGGEKEKSKKVRTLGGEAI